MYQKKYQYLRDISSVSPFLGIFEADKQVLAYL